MNKSAAGFAGHSQRIIDKLPWLKRALQYSFVFFLVKGLLWTALFTLPLVGGLL